MSSIDPLKDFSGKSPYKTGVNIAISPQAMFLIGYITVQWGSLMEQIAFQIRWKSKFPLIPKSLREQKVRHEAKQQITFLRQIGKIAYAKERKTAVKELEKILDAILEFKVTRDALAHGTFDLTANHDPNIVVVNYKRMKIPFTLEFLKRTGDEIGIANGTLMMFDQWVNYEKFATLLEKLPPQAGQ